MAIQFNFVKKFIYILLAFFIFFNSGGFLFTFFTFKHIIKVEMFSEIREHLNSKCELEFFRFNDSELFSDTKQITWDSKEEFYYNGKLYDVVCIKNDAKDSNIKIIYAINDNKEEKLIHSFNSLIDDLVNGNTANPKIRTILFNLISQALIQNGFNLNYCIQYVVVYKEIIIQFLSFQQSPDSPPPKNL
jgi:hypothetical protein